MSAEGEGAATPAAVEEETDYYALLGIPRGSDQATVKKAYKKLAATFHPDRHAASSSASASSGAAAERFTKITEAYETLMDDQKRAVYDKYGANTCRTLADHLKTPEELEELLSKMDRQKTKQALRQRFKMHGQTVMVPAWAFIYHPRSGLLVPAPLVGHLALSQSYEEQIGENYGLVLGTMLTMTHMAKSSGDGQFLVGVRRYFGVDKSSQLYTQLGLGLNVINLRSEYQARLSPSSHGSVSGYVDTQGGSLSLGYVEALSEGSRGSVTLSMGNQNQIKALYETNELLPDGTLTAGLKFSNIDFTSDFPFPLPSFQLNYSTRLSSLEKIELGGSFKLFSSSSFSALPPLSSSVSSLSSVSALSLSLFSAFLPSFHLSYRRSLSSNSKFGLTSSISISGGTRLDFWYQHYDQKLVFPQVLSFPLLPFFQQLVSDLLLLASSPSSNEVDVISSTSALELQQQQNFEATSSAVQMVVSLLLRGTITMLPPVAMALAGKYWLNPKRQREKREKRAQRKMARAKSVEERRRQAEMDVELMRATVRSKQNKERSKGGLVILEAKYGCFSDEEEEKKKKRKMKEKEEKRTTATPKFRSWFSSGGGLDDNEAEEEEEEEEEDLFSDDDDDDEEEEETEEAKEKSTTTTTQTKKVIDVTTPVQYLVEDSQICLLHDCKKSSLLGFYDPCPGSHKQLFVQYLFKDKVHEVMFDDEDDIILPLEEHRVGK